MADISQALLKTGSGYDYEDGEGRTADLSAGGHAGYVPDYAHWINSQPYLRSPLIIILLDVPTMYKADPRTGFVENPTAWQQAIRALFETQATSITGFTNELTVTKEEVQLGNDGASFFEVGAASQIARSEVTFEYPADKIGRPINKVLSHWIKWGIADPTSGYANLHTQHYNAADPTRETLADMYSASYIAIQPDRSGKIVDTAWLVRNSWPTTAGPIIGERVQGTPPTLEALSIPMTGLISNNSQTKALAQGLLNTMMRQGERIPDRAPIAGSADEYNPDSNLPPLNTNGVSTGYADSVNITKVDS